MSGWVVACLGFLNHEVIMPPRKWSLSSLLLYAASKYGILRCC